MGSDGETLYGMVKQGLMRPYLLPQGSLGVLAVPWCSSLVGLFVSAPFSPIPSPPLTSTGFAGLCGTNSAQGFHLPSPRTSCCVLQKKKRKKPQSSFMLPFTSMQIIHYLLQSQCVLISLFAILAVCIVLRIWDENGASLYFPIYLTFFHKNT